MKLAMPEIPTMDLEGWGFEPKDINWSLNFQGVELEIEFTHVINDSIHHGHVITLDTKAQVSFLVGEHING